MHALHSDPVRNRQIRMGEIPDSPHAVSRQDRRHFQGGLGRNSKSRDIHPVLVQIASKLRQGMDDGSSSLEESLAMLEISAEQGVDEIFATSHFYPNEEDPASFLERRTEAYEELTAFLTEEAKDVTLPRIHLGAEVYYFRGITRMAELPSLRLEGTRLLLLEMPFAPWSEGEVREVIDLCHDGDFVVMLAHIDRYLKYQKRAVWDRLLEEGAVMQANADCFLPLLSGRRAVRMRSVW